MCTYRYGLVYRDLPVVNNGGVFKDFFSLCYIIPKTFNKEQPSVTMCPTIIILDFNDHYSSIYANHIDRYYYLDV